MKALWIPGRAVYLRLFKKSKEANSGSCRKRRTELLSEFDDSTELDTNSALEIDYVVAPPDGSIWNTAFRIWRSIYLENILAPEDIFLYSIDEAFMDVTNYLHTL